MKRNLISASALAIGAAMLPATAFAQSAVDVLQDTILVKGTKKKDAENVQDVPLAVTAYGEDQLNALQVQSLASLTTSMPNVQLEDIGTSKGVANFSIRGLGINSSIPSIDPTVGVFTDGMYLGINNGVVLDIFDLESVEVLRGPQGILFGRNVTGGAVLINTKKPGDEYEAKLKASVESGLRGTGESYTIQGAVGGPIIEDMLSFRVSAYYNDDGGWHKRYLGGGVPSATADFLATVDPDIAAVRPLLGGPQPEGFEDFGASETVLVRPSLRYTPTDYLEVLVRYEHGEVDGDGPAGQNHTNGLGLTNPFFSAPRDSFTFSINNTGYIDAEWDQVIAEVNWDVAFGDGTITNIFGWRDFSQLTDGDIDATPLNLFHSATETQQDQLSNELRYNGTFGEIFDVTAGVNYFTQDIAYGEARTITGGASQFNGGGKIDHRAIGVFASVDVAVSDVLTLTFGGRYSDEKKDARIATVIFNGINEGVPVPGGVIGCDVIVDECPYDTVGTFKVSKFTPKVGFQWAARDDMNVYGHWTQGVRSGGFNVRSSSAVFAPGPFDEELVNAFELGFKAQPGDGKAQINAAFFYNDINNMQRELNLADPIAGVVQVIRNTADARILGFEVESQIALSDSLLFQGSLGYTDGKYQTVLFDLNSDGLINDADLDPIIPRLAPWTYSAGFIHSMPVGDDLFVNTRLNYSHRDASFYSDNNQGFFLEQDIIDASIALHAFDNRAVLSLYGKNLLNQVNHGNDSQLPPALGGGTFAPLAKGRVVGISLELATN